MCPKSRQLRLALVSMCLLSPTVLMAQQVTITTPSQAVSERFYERTGVSWSVGGPGFSASFGGGGGAPPFGGANPAAGIQSGWGFRSGNLRGRLFFGAAQGVERTHTTTAPVLTLTPGIPGQLFAGRTRPFVTGVTSVAAPVPRLQSVSPVELKLRQLQQERQAQALAGGGFAKEEDIPPAPAPPPPLRVAAFEQLEGRRELTATTQTRRNEAARPLKIETVQPEQPAPTPAAPLTVQTPAVDARRAMTPAEYLIRGEQAERKKNLRVARIYYRLAAKRGSKATRDAARKRLISLERK